MTMPKLLAPMLLLATACTPACTPPAAGTADATREQGKPEGEATPAPAAAKPAENMIREAPGVDLSALSEAQKSAFFDLLNVEPSACGKPHALAVSLRDDTTCRDSLVVAQFLADRLGEGATPSAVKGELEMVRRALTPQKIDTSGCAVWGNERAPVTLVVFADFQCPHCKAEVPKLRAAVEKYRGRAKLVFMHFPLKSHPEAKTAAIAVEAAGAQGKFWQMHDKVFAHQMELSDADLERYAKEIGLDMARFKADLAGEKARAHVDKDRSEGERLEIMGTPTIYVNGREFTELLFGGTIEGWIDEALKR